MRKHLERHHPGVIGHAVDGVIHKEGMHFGRERGLRDDAGVLIEGDDLVDERETLRIGDQSSHARRQLERRFAEGAEGVHRTEAAAAEHAALATGEGLVHKQLHADVNRQRLDASGLEHGFDGASGRHADVAPTGPPDGHGAACTACRQASHFGIQD